jgi:hypothetical protein
LPAVEERARQLGLIPLELTRIVVFEPRGAVRPRIPPPLPAPASIPGRGEDGRQ